MITQKHIVVAVFGGVFLIGALSVAGCNKPAKKKEEPKAEPAAEAPPEQVSTSDDPYAAPSDVAAPPADAQKTTSGLATKVLSPATGTDKPQSFDKVKVNYTGWQTDGKMFDSSLKRGRPAEFPVDGVIPGWTEGLQLMAVGEKRRMWIPEMLAYKGRQGPPKGMLVFDVELLEIIKGEPPVPAPEDVAAAPADAKTESSGLAHKVLEPGTGKDHPKATDRVKVEYTGWQTDGKMFDSSKKRGQPATFVLNGVIPGWTEGVQLMVAGEKRRFWIPQDLAYKGRPGPPAGTLVFDIQLLEIMEGPPGAPKDVAAPPKNAKKTSTGLAYRVLKKGTGSDKPGATDRVTVHYTGWTTDGKMFDSSRQRGAPATFGLNGVIAGWTEGLQLMVVGEQTRFWIPEALAYKGSPGKPAGMLVFDVELISIGK